MPDEALSIETIRIVPPFDSFAGMAHVHKNQSIDKI